MTWGEFPCPTECLSSSLQMRTHWVSKPYYKLGAHIVDSSAAWPANSWAPLHVKTHLRPRRHFRHRCYERHPFFLVFFKHLQHQSLRHPSTPLLLLSSACSANLPTLSGKVWANLLQNYTYQHSRYKEERMKRHSFNELFVRSHSRFMQLQALVVAAAFQTQTVCGNIGAAGAL